MVIISDTMETPSPMKVMTSTPRLACGLGATSYSLDTRRKKLFNNLIQCHKLCIIQLHLTSRMQKLVKWSHSHSVNSRSSDTIRQPSVENPPNPSEGIQV